VPSYDLALCVGCSQCIALCPEEALKVIWRTDLKDFQERLVETAEAIWKEISDRTWVINALIQIAAECDCWAGEKCAVIAPDYGFIAGGHPVVVDEASLRQTGTEPFDRAHEGLPWQRQFSYAREIGFHP
ncbi:MAG: 4Fe-4S binding protein, partial [Syntrophaceae bacterium]|nr:4Fe-4S binding protein [Syntrophaceae bacterium]